MLTSELVIATNLFISGPGTNNLMVSVDLDPNIYSRIFNVTGGTNLISGLTLAFGFLDEQSGGAILNAGTLTVSDCLILANFAAYGRAVANTGSLSLNGVEIRSNEAVGGGGIYNVSSGNIMINNCSILGNKASFEKGGGIENFGGNVSINRTLIANNFAKYDGGGIDNFGTLSIAESVFSGNSANEIGGAIANVGTLEVTACTFFSNHAFYFGHAIYNLGPAVINNSTFSENSSCCGDIALFGASSSMALTNCTVFGNRGGVASSAVVPGTVTLRNCIVAGNRYSDCYGIINSGDFNLIQNTNDFTLIGSTNHCILGQSAQLMPLLDNGGPTKTYALLPSSPAIDNGHSSGFTNDQRGLPRPLDDPAVTNVLDGDGSDIGAYELNPTDIQTGPTFVVNSTNDLDDGVCTALHCSLREAVRLANAYPGTNSLITFGIEGTIITGDFNLTNHMFISGPSAKSLTIRAYAAGNGHRIFNVPAGVNVSISGLTLAGANNSAIYNQGNLALRSCSVSSNWASFGGGVYSSGTLTVDECTFEGNGGTYGGGVRNNGTMFVRDSTFSRNIVSGGGGGVWNLGVASVFNSTICSNATTWNYIGGGIMNDGTLNLRSTIIAGNSVGVGGAGPDVSGTIISRDFNLIQNTNGSTITGTKTHDIYSQTPRLGPLQYNGDPTMTHALLSGSPAIDAGYSGGLSTDQRGRQRAIDIPTFANPAGGDGTDIGAVEVDNFITSIERVGPDVRLSFVTGSNQVYRVEHTAALPPTNWITLPDVFLGTGGVQSGTNLGAALLPRGFYRVRAD